MLGQQLKEGLQRMWSAVLNDECKTAQLSAGVDLVTLPSGAAWLTDDTSPHLFVRKSDRDVFDKMMADQKKSIRGCVLIGSPGIGNLLTGTQANSPFRQKLVTLLLFISFGQRIQQEYIL